MWQGHSEEVLGVIISFTDHGHHWSPPDNAYPLSSTTLDSEAVLDPLYAGSCGHYAVRSTNGELMLLPFLLGVADIVIVPAEP